MSLPPVALYLVTILESQLCSGVSCETFQSISIQLTLLPDYFQVITMRLQIRGFIVLDCASKWKEYVGLLADAYKDGKLKIGKDVEHVVPAKFEDIPSTWLQLFEGANQGKLITKL